MKFGFTKSLLVTALVFGLGAASGAQAKDNVKQARDNDIATSYGLTKKGTLYRMVNGEHCDVTTNVESFKISQHPNDLAMVYYKKDGDLYALGRSFPIYLGCPKANSKKLMSDVKKYNVTSNTHTTIVNVALSQSGKFVAWDNVAPVFTVTGADDYQMNQNFGAEGKPFSSYVTFVHSDRGGYVMKVKGIEPSASKWDTSRYYSSIRDFKEVNHLDSDSE